MVEKRQDEPVPIRGVGVGADANVARYPAGRVCEEFACGTLLSVYNASAFCWQHEPRRRLAGAPPGRPRTDRALQQMGEGIWARPS